MRRRRQRSLFGAWERRSFPVSIKRVHDMPDVPGLVETECPGLGLNQSAAKNMRTGKYDWNLTHLPTGMRIMSHPSKQQIQKALLELCRLTKEHGATWDVPQDSITPDMKGTAWHVFQKYRWVPAAERRVRPKHVMRGTWPGTR